MNSYVCDSIGQVWLTDDAIGSDNHVGEANLQYLKEYAKNNDLKCLELCGPSTIKNTSGYPKLKTTEFMEAVNNQDNCNHNIAIDADAFQNDAHVIILHYTFGGAEAYVRKCPETKNLRRQVEGLESYPAFDDTLVAKAELEWWIDGRLEVDPETEQSFRDAGHKRDDEEDSLSPNQ